MRGRKKIKMRKEEMIREGLKGGVGRKWEEWRRRERKGRQSETEI